VWFSMFLTLQDWVRFIRMSRTLRLRTALDLLCGFGFVLLCIEHGIPLPSILPGRTYDEV